MNTYDLDNPDFLQHDIEEILDRLSELYEVDFSAEPFVFTSKIMTAEGAFWAGQEVQEQFNKIIPQFKSLIKDIYAIIEVIHVSRDGKFNKPTAEMTYPNLLELRMLNNKLKHFKDNGLPIKIISMVNLSGQRNFIDILVQFGSHKGKMEIKTFGQLALPFLRILEDFKLITIDKAQNGKH